MTHQIINDIIMILKLRNQTQLIVLLFYHKEKQ
jgi:hypothetical protein